MSFVDYNLDLSIHCGNLFFSARLLLIKLLIHLCQQHNVPYSRTDNDQWLLEEEVIEGGAECWAEYVYLFKNGDWYVAELYEETKRMGFVLLEAVIDNDFKIPKMKTF